MWGAKFAATRHLFTRFAWVAARLIFGQRQSHHYRNEECDAPTMKCHLRMIHAGQKIHYDGEAATVI
jgi:hypothetical protein